MWPEVKDPRRILGGRLQLEKAHCTKLLALLENNRFPPAVMKADAKLGAESRINFTRRNLDALKDPLPLTRDEPEGIRRYADHFSSLDRTRVARLERKALVRNGIVNVVAAIVPTLTDA
jgi:hypothetical protein